MRGAFLTLLLPATASAEKLYVGRWYTGSCTGAPAKTYSSETDMCVIIPGDTIMSFTFTKSGSDTWTEQVYTSADPTKVGEGCTGQAATISWKEGDCVTMSGGSNERWMASSSFNFQSSDPRATIPLCPTAAWNDGLKTCFVKGDGMCATAFSDLAMTGGKTTVAMCSCGSQQCTSQGGGSLTAILGYAAVKKGTDGSDTAYLTDSSLYTYSNSYIASSAFSWSHAGVDFEKDGKSATVAQLLESISVGGLGNNGVWGLMMGRANYMVTKGEFDYSTNMFPWKSTGMGASYVCVTPSDSVTVGATPSGGIAVGDKPSDAGANCGSKTVSEGKLKFSLYGGGFGDWKSNWPDGANYDYLGFRTMVCVFGDASFEKDGDQVKTMTLTQKDGGKTTHTFPQTYLYGDGTGKRQLTGADEEYWTAQAVGGVGTWTAPAKGIKNIKIFQSDVPSSEAGAIPMCGGGESKNIYIDYLFELEDIYNNQGGWYVYDPEVSGGGGGGDDGGLGSGAIFGIILGVMLGLGLIAVGVFFAMKAQSQSSFRKQQQVTQEDLQTAQLTSMN